MMPYARDAGNKSVLHVLVGITEGMSVHLLKALHLMAIYGVSYELVHGNDFSLERAGFMLAVSQLYSY